MEMKGKKNMGNIIVNVERLIELLDLLIENLEKRKVEDMDIEISTDMYDPYTMKPLMQTIKIRYRLEV